MVRSDTVPDTSPSHCNAPLRTCRIGKRRTFMSRRIVAFAGIMTLAASTAFADFTYQETTKITGGALISAMKVAGVFSKQARQMGEPMQSTVAVKGDRMVHRSKIHASVIDLASQTI